MGVSTRLPGRPGSRLRGWCCLGLGLLLLASWLGGPIRPLWDRLDLWFFRLSNSSLGLNPLWDGLWAVSNNRLFDLVAALGMTAVFFWSGLSSRPGRWSQLLVRALIGALLGLLAQGLIHQYLDLPRASPTLQMEGSQRLSQLVTWIRSKDASRGCFPGDHGLVLFTLTLYGWRFLQPRARWTAAAGAVLFTLPRLMSGAHWLTDILCGSIPVGLITVGLYDGLGLAPVIDHRLVPVLEHWLRQLTPPRLRQWLDQRPGRRTGAAPSARPPVPSRPG
jgi:membrane-associated phospholipid phosphatase